ncbi:hypothetical protein RhiirB3_386815 [Rhizophagus irregularis]|nr:hypothetical protein RhiirB3_386815 [Rhizophagus irregularis]
MAYRNDNESKGNNTEEFGENIIEKFKGCSIEESKDVERNFIYIYYNMGLTIGVIVLITNKVIIEWILLNGIGLNNNLNALIMLLMLILPLIYLNTKTYLNT